MKTGSLACLNLPTAPHVRCEYKFCRRPEEPTASTGQDNTEEQALVGFWYIAESVTLMNSVALLRVVLLLRTQPRSCPV